MNVKMLILIYSVLVYDNLSFSFYSHNVCQRLATCLWFPPGTPVSSTNKTDIHDITEISLKVAVNTNHSIYSDWR
jgi:hypothetical protein